MSTKAMPLSRGMAAKNFLKASIPPARTPMLTMTGPGMPRLGELSGDSLSTCSGTAASVFAGVAL